LVDVREPLAGLDPHAGRGVIVGFPGGLQALACPESLRPSQGVGAVLGRVQPLEIGEPTILIPAGVLVDAGILDPMEVGTAVEESNLQPVPTHPPWNVVRKAPAILL
jgi:hypothetical protein